MKASTREWVVKAEEDFAAATALARPRKKPLWAPVCFHAQQCSEKYLKARLNEASIQFHKTHDLEKLLNQTLADKQMGQKKDASRRHARARSSSLRVSRSATSKGNEYCILDYHRSALQFGNVHANSMKPTQLRFRFVGGLLWLAIL